MLPAAVFCVLLFTENLTGLINPLYQRGITLLVSGGGQNDHSIFVFSSSFDFQSTFVTLASLLPTCHYASNGLKKRTILNTRGSRTNFVRQFWEKLLHRSLVESSTVLAKNCICSELNVLSDGHLEISKNWFWKSTILEYMYIYIFNVVFSSILFKTREYM